jgi:phage gpG-like protein
VPRVIAVRVEGLAELRRDLRATDRETLREVQGTLRNAAGIAAAQAALLVARRTGALAASYRAYARGNRAGVRSSLPYAGVVEYGGTIRPRGTAIKFRRSLPVSRAVLRETDTIVEAIGDGIEAAARRTGWR